MSLIMSKWGDSTAALRVSTVFQDLLVFIMPPIVTALMITRLPADFLEIIRRPNPAAIFFTITTMVVSVPMMNVIIDWNANVPFFDSIIWIKEMEQNAQASVEKLLGPSTFGNLIISVLIVGCLTGFAEEIFFRGGVQKLLMCTRLNPHIVIWSTAIIFSLFHLQFYGFVPRLLLGAFFGYLMWWSGSLWISVIAHAFNNSVVVVSRWIVETCPSTPNIDKIGVYTDFSSVLIVCLSILMTTIGVVLVKKASLRKLKHSDVQML